MLQVFLAGIVAFAKSVWQLKCTDGGANLFKGHMDRKTIFTYLVELFSLVKMPFPVSFYDLNLSRYGARKPEKGTFKSDATRTRADRRCDVIGLTRPFDSHCNMEKPLRCK